MKKKLGILFSSLLLILILVGCSLNINDPKATIGQVFTDDTTYELIQTNITKTAEEVDSACVAVYVEYESFGQKVASIGSGVIYRMLDKKTGQAATEETKDVMCYVVTNEHVINIENGRNPNYYIYLGDDNYIEADPIGSDASNDVAILSFDAKLNEYDLSSVNIMEGELSLPTVGNYCIAIGTPLDLENYNYVSVGNVAKISLSEIMHTAAINPGNSGGALFSITGKLLGINARKNTIIEEENEIIPIEGMGYAIPVWTLKDVIGDIESTHEAIDRPTLGVTVTTINATLNRDDADKIPGTMNQGVVIVEIVEGGNAYNATSNDELAEGGLQIGDVIYKFNDKEISRNQDVSYELSLLLKGDDVKFTIFRKINNEWQELEYFVTLK